MTNTTTGAPGLVGPRADVTGPAGAAAVDTPAAPGYTAIRQGAALLDLTGTGLFEVTGPGAGALLASATTRSVDFLLEGQSQQALLLTPEGLVVGDVVVHGLASGFLVQVWPDQAAAVGAVLVAAGSEHPGATVNDVSADHVVLGVEGPRSFAVVSHYVDFAISSLGYKAWGPVSWHGHSLMLSRTGVTGEFGYVLIAPVAAGPDLLVDLLAHGTEQASRTAVDVCRMEMRFPNLEAEIPTRGATPFHLGLPWLLDFAGDFTGKEALQGAAGTTELPVCWQGPVGATAVPAPGTPVGVKDAVIGHVQFAVHSPLLDRCIGTALVDRDCAATGLTLQIDGVEVQTTSAPFLIPTSFQTTMD